MNTLERLDQLARRYTTPEILARAITNEFIVIPRSELPPVVKHTPRRSLRAGQAVFARDADAHSFRKQGLDLIAVSEWLQEHGHDIEEDKRRTDLAWQSYGMAYHRLPDGIQKLVDRVIELEAKE